MAVDGKNFEIGEDVHLCPESPDLRVVGFALDPDRVRVRWGDHEVDLPGTVLAHGPRPAEPAEPASDTEIKFYDEVGIEKKLTEQQREHLSLFSMMAALRGIGDAAQESETQHDFSTVGLELLGNLVPLLHKAAMSEKPVGPQSLDEMLRDAMTEVGKPASGPDEVKKRREKLDELIRLARRVRQNVEVAEYLLKTPAPKDLGTDAASMSPGAVSSGDGKPRLCYSRYPETEQTREHYVFRFYPLDCQPDGAESLFKTWAVVEKARMLRMMDDCYAYSLTVEQFEVAKPILDEEFDLVEVETE